MVTGVLLLSGLRGGGAGWGRLTRRRRRTWPRQWDGLGTPEKMVARMGRLMPSSLAVDVDEGLIFTWPVSSWRRRSAPVGSCGRAVAGGGSEDQVRSEERRKKRSRG